MESLAAFNWQCWDAFHWRCVIVLHCLSSQTLVSVACWDHTHWFHPQRHRCCSDKTLEEPGDVPVSTESLLEEDRSRSDGQSTSRDLQAHVTVWTDSDSVEGVINSVVWLLQRLLINISFCCIQLQSTVTAPPVGKKHLMQRGTMGRGRGIVV